MEFCTTLQFCYVSHATFSLSSFSLFLERCTKYIESIQHYKVAIKKEKIDVAHIVLRTGRRGKGGMKYIETSWAEQFISFYLISPLEL
jgi:hypothetical protein